MVSRYALLTLLSTFPHDLEAGLHSDPDACCIECHCCRIELDLNSSHLSPNSGTTFAEWQCSAESIILQSIASLLTLALFQGHSVEIVDTDGLSSGIATPQYSFGTSGVLNLNGALHKHISSDFISALGRGASFFARPCGSTFKLNGPLHITGRHRPDVAKSLTSTLSNSKTRVTNTISLWVRRTNKKMKKWTQYTTRLTRRPTRRCVLSGSFVPPFMPC